MCVTIPVVWRYEDLAFNGHCKDLLFYSPNPNFCVVSFVKTDPLTCLTAGKYRKILFLNPITGKSQFVSIYDSCGLFTPSTTKPADLYGTSAPKVCTSVMMFMSVIVFLCCLTEHTVGA